MPLHLSILVLITQIEEPFYVFHEIIEHNNRKPGPTFKYVLHCRKKGRCNTNLEWQSSATWCMPGIKQSADELVLCHFRSINITPAWNPFVTIISSLAYVAISVRKRRRFVIQSSFLVSPHEPSIVVVSVWGGAGAAVGNCGANGGTTHMALYNES